MADWPDLPDFLRIPAETRKASWRGKRLTCVRPEPQRRRNWMLPATLEPAGLKLLREIEQRKDEAKRARLAALKERRR